MNEYSHLIGVMVRENKLYKNHNQNKIEHVELVYTNKNIINGLYVSNYDFLEPISKFSYAWAQNEDAETEWVSFYIFNILYHHGLKHPYPAKLINGGTVLVRTDYNDIKSKIGDELEQVRLCSYYHKGEQIFNFFHKSEFMKNGDK